MYANKEQVTAELQSIRDAGLYKEERPLMGPQGALVQTLSGRALNFCANNYLGLADDPRIVAASKESLDQWGYGLSSVRFICGTQEQHLALEYGISQYLRRDDTILFSSCFDANGGIFQVLFGPEDAIVSDALNHASLIDGIRLCKAKRFRYANRDMADLRAQLVAAREAGAKTIVIVTDGVFSMDGYYARCRKSAIWRTSLAPW